MLAGEIKRGRCRSCLRRYERQRGSATARGYTKEHQRNAARVIAAHPYCADCHSTEDLCADHIVPLSRGGTNELDNYEVRCRSCNTARRNVDRRQQAAQGGAGMASKEKARKDPTPRSREIHSEAALIKRIGPRPRFSRSTFTEGGDEGPARSEP
jgi:5-methylcytosine-specific restriction enzyme A